MSVEPPQLPYDPGQPQSWQYVTPIKDDRLWATFCHLGGLAPYVGGAFVNIAIPLVIWLLKKDDSPFVDDQGKESLNFQISMTLYIMVAGILVIVAVGFLLLLALAIFNFVVVIIAAIKANQGIAYRYPLCIRFIA